MNSPDKSNLLKFSSKEQKSLSMDLQTKVSDGNNQSSNLKLT